MFQIATLIKKMQNSRTSNRFSQSKATLQRDFDTSYSFIDFRNQLNVTSIHCVLESLV